MAGYSYGLGSAVSSLGLQISDPLPHTHLKLVVNHAAWLAGLGSQVTHGGGHHPTRNACWMMQGEESAQEKNLGNYFQRGLVNAGGIEQSERLG